MGVPTAAHLADVEVIGDSGTALLCMIGERQVWVPVLEMKYGNEIAKVGDRGKLVMSGWLAEQVGLR